VRSCGRLPGAARLARAALAAALGFIVAGPAHAQSADPAPRGTRHALIIGIGEYSDPAIAPLKGMQHDMASARRMARVMAVPDEHIRVLRDGDAHAERIRGELRALDARVRAGDRVFVYYSGHGTRWYDEALRREGCTEGLMAADGQALTNTEISRLLAPIAQRADKLLVFYDACYSGGVAGEPFRTRSLAVDREIVSPKFTRAGAPEICPTR
jgi:uncharacterized caspase-like protein